MAVRFKDDYRILCDSEHEAKQIIKSLQNSLREFDLDINEEKTKIYKLPDGLFRPWVSRYHAANPTPKNYYSYKQFKEVYLSVIATDRDLPGTGIVDRFLADIITSDDKPNFEINKITIPKIISLLMMLAKLRIKSFPKILAIIESIMHAANQVWYTNLIGNYLGAFLDTLAKESEKDNRYLIIWILYFLKSNRMERFIAQKYIFLDPVVKTVQSGRSSLFVKSKDFKLFSGILNTSKNKSLLEHLKLFSPQ